jgi:hypothetical protein
MSYTNGLAALRREAASIAEWVDKGKGKNNKGMGKGLGKSKTDSSKGKGKNSNGTSNEATGGHVGSAGASLWDDPEGDRLWDALAARGQGASSYARGHLGQPEEATPLPEEATPLPDEVMPLQEEAPQEEAMQVQPLALAGLHQRRRWRSSLPAHLTAAGRCSSSSGDEAPP